MENKPDSIFIFFVKNSQSFIFMHLGASLKIVNMIWIHTQDKHIRAFHRQNIHFHILYNGKSIVSCSILICL